MKPITEQLLAEVNIWLKKAKSSKFSKLLGMGHENLTGRKMLLVRPSDGLRKSNSGFRN
jgi:hypothetical protein